MITVDLLIDFLQVVGLDSQPCEGKLVYEKEISVCFYYLTRFEKNYICIRKNEFELNIEFGIYIKFEKSTN